MLNKLVKQYLESVYSQQINLVQQNQLLKPFDGLRTCDIPSRYSNEELLELNQLVKSYGYSGLNIGLTSLWSSSSIEYFVAVRSLDIKTAHGTSVKWQLKNNKSFSEALNYDKKVLDLIDPNETITVNYDLFAGKALDRLPDDFNEAVNKNSQAIAFKLGLKKIKSYENSIISYIVQEVAKVFATSKRPVVFEVPGTRGWSMFPSPYSISEVVEQIDKYFRKADLCIDVGHVLTWETMNRNLGRIVKLFKPYSKRIKMVHISSAGSHLDIFKNAYKIYHGRDFPAWHLNGLDLMLAVHEKEILSLVREIRDLTDNQNLIEVCETRRPTRAINDYLEKYPRKRINNSPYLNSLKHQARLLGYHS